jgi:hypothetical protein
MHRATFPLVAILLSGCASQQPQLPPVSIKDARPRPRVAAVVKPDVPASVVRRPVAFTGVKPADVFGAHASTNQALAMGMFHALTLSGVNVSSTGNWRIVAVVEGDSIRWALYDHTGSVVSTVDQSGKHSDLVTMADPIARSAALVLTRFVPQPHRGPR